MEPIDHASEACTGSPCQIDRRCAAIGRRGRLPRRRRAGMVRALARKPQGPRTRARAMTTTMTSSVLSELVAHLASGAVRVIDLSQTLSPDFPQISLPPEMGQSAPFRIEEISKYDERGPGWYWNNISCGEHT